MKTICPHCKQKYDVDDDFLQREVACTVCNQSFIVNKAKFCADCGTINPAQAFKCTQCGKEFPIPAGTPGASHGYKQKHSYPESVSMLTALRKYADFSGRASRREFWLWFLFNLICCVLLLLLTAFAPKGGQILSGIFILTSTIPTLAVSVRRLHDLGKSGIGILLLLLLFWGGCVLLICFMFHSQPGPNQYGDNPNGVDEPDANWKFSSWILWLGGALAMVILLASAILFSVLDLSREEARIIKCGNSTKQLGLALLMYAYDYEEQLPVAIGKDFVTILKREGYLHDEEIDCPSANEQENSYIYLGSGLTVYQEYKLLPLIIDHPLNHPQPHALIGGDSLMTLQGEFADCETLVLAVMAKNKIPSDSKAAKIVLRNAKEADMRLGLKP